MSLHWPGSIFLSFLPFPTTPFLLHPRLPRSPSSLCILPSSVCCGNTKRNPAKGDRLQAENFWTLNANYLVSWYIQYADHLPPPSGEGGEKPPPSGWGAVSSGISNTIKTAFNMSCLASRHVMNQWERRFLRGKKKMCFERKVCKCTEHSPLTAPAWATPSL